MQTSPDTKPVDDLFSGDGRNSVGKNSVGRNSVGGRTNLGGTDDNVAIVVL